MTLQVKRALVTGAGKRLGRAMALELAERGFDVAVHYAGSEEAAQEVADMIRASMPIGRLGEPREIAEAAVWLCSDRSSLATGSSFGIDGGSVAR